MVKVKILSIMHVYFLVIRMHYNNLRKFIKDVVER